MVLSVRAVSKSFGAVQVADNITFDLQSGDAVGVIGPNGAGKTSLFNLITGELAPASGTIAFDGADITKLATRERSKLGIVRTYQIPLPFVGLSVFENVLVGAIFAAGDRIRHPERFCMEILRHTGLSDRADCPAGTLSLLDRKRLELARALAADPRILLLDEIAGGLTEAECIELVDLIRSVERRGIVIVWIEHIVHALLRIVRRLIVLDRGRIVASGNPKEVMTSSRVREIYLGVEPDAEDQQ